MSEGPGRYRGPADPAQRELWRRERRQVLRRHHPDRGGDAADLQRELERVDRRYPGPGPATAPGPPGPADRTVVVPPPLSVRLARRAGRAVNAAIRAGRARAPRSWPGSRRYHDI